MPGRGHSLWQMFDFKQQALLIITLINQFSQWRTEPKYK
jgi:hypothetical protein